jgi:glycosyltransferase involved in cell wall biosynthesis
VADRLIPEQTRLCFVAYRGNMNCGGQGVYLWFLTRELARMGFEVDVFVGPPYPDPMPFAGRVVELPNREFWGKWFGRDYAGMLPEARPLGIFEPLNFYELASSRLGFLPEPFAFSMRAFAALAREMRAGARWDLVHDVQCLGYGLLGIRAMGVPVVTTVHHPLTVDRRASFIRDTNVTEAIGSMQFYPIGMQSFVARRIEGVLTSSQCSVDQIAGDFGVPRRQITNVWNGLDSELFCPDESVAKSKNELLCVGRAADPNKGIKTLIQALGRLPEPIHLTLIDNDHPGNEVFKWAREAGVADRLVVTGRVSSDALIEHYRRAAIVVVPSRHEGFGLPAVEAMACGTPVVSCAAGALREVMELTGGGLVVPIDDAEGLAKAIETLMGRPEERARMASHGRDRVLENFSWSRVAAATAQVYAEVLAARRGRPTTMITSARVGATRASQSMP